MPKLKTNGSSRAGSPLAGGSQPTSPIGSPSIRADSPPVQSPTTGSASPPLGGAKLNNKRKMDDGEAPKPKKRKSQVTVPVGGGGLEDWMLVEWLKQTPNATTRDCIHHFTPFLTTEDKKANFTKLVKEVAQLKSGILVLRPSYRGSSAPSPMPNSPTHIASPA